MNNSNTHFDRSPTTLQMRNAPLNVLFTPNTFFRVLTPIKNTCDVEELKGVIKIIVTEVSFIWSENTPYMFSVTLIFYLE